MGLTRRWPLPVGGLPCKPFHGPFAVVHHPYPDYDRNPRDFVFYEMKDEFSDEWVLCDSPGRHTIYDLRRYPKSEEIPSYNLKWY